MEILLNNRKEEIPNIDNLTVQELLRLKKYSYKMLMVRINHTTVKTDQYQSAVIKDGDTVSIIHLMTGG
jgi:thiamine biosynthesis protein ThiS